MPKHWGFWEWLAYAALFIAAAVMALNTALAGAPHLLAALPSILRAAWWNYVPLSLLTLSGIAFLVRRLLPPVRSPGEPTVSIGTPQAIPTHALLDFPSGNGQPTCRAQTNIWRWYALAHVTVITNVQTGRSEQHKAWHVFLVFDVPVAFRQVQVSALGGGQLPLHEVKDSSPRHALISFMGDVAGTAVDFSLLL